MTSSETAIAGTLTDGVHDLPIRVYYEDTDFSGVVYHANYVRYFERGRSDFLRLLGIHHSELAALPEPLAFAVAHIDMRFRAPARIDDVVIVRTTPVAIRGALFVLDQRVMRDDVTLCEARVEVACIDLRNRPRRLPKALTERIAACLPAEDAS